MADTQAAAQNGTEGQPPVRFTKLLGTIFLRGNIELRTGMRIGATSSSLSIGGVENVVIRNPLNDQPYIPGSSLRGKMRSLSEKFNGRPQNWPIQNIRIHICRERAAYDDCPVCPVFGVPGELEASAPTRLKVRDTFLTAESVDELSRLRTDLPFTEVKWEASIDRITSKAVPRQMERVPAGAVFGPFELVYTVYEDRDLERFLEVVRAMEMVEDDYLGGQGSRGYGQVAFTDVELLVKARGDYGLSKGARQVLTGPGLSEFQDALSQHPLRDLFRDGGTGEAAASTEAQEG